MTTIICHRGSGFAWSTPPLDFRSSNICITDDERSISFAKMHPEDFSVLEDVSCMVDANALEVISNPTATPHLEYTTEDVASSDAPTADRAAPEPQATEEAVPLIVEPEKTDIRPASKPKNRSK